MDLTFLKIISHLHDMVTPTATCHTQLHQPLAPNSNAPWDTVTYHQRKRPPGHVDIYCSQASASTLSERFPIGIAGSEVLSAW